MGELEDKPIEKCVKIVFSKEEIFKLHWALLYAQRDLAALSIEDAVYSELLNKVFKAARELVI